MPETRSRELRSWLVPALALLLTVLTGFGAWDLATDAPRERFGLHGAIDLAFLVVAAGAAALLARGWLRAERDLAGLGRLAESHRAERDQWRNRAQSLLRGLGEALDRQFEDWRLTPAEKDTALFLLKGFSHKEIAALSVRSERTVRQHAVAVYRKSGLAGRAELAAFFFEDMLLPAEPPSGADSGGAGAAPGA